ncbi:MAG: PKD domain-containing protein, partial [candidate division KSB1 bacterium]
ERGAALLARTGYSEVAPYRGMLQEVANGSSQPIGARAFPQARYLLVRREGFFSSLMMANLVEPHMEASSLAPIYGAVNIVTPASKDKLSEQKIYAHPRALLNAMTVPADYEDATYEASSQYSGREDLGAITGMLRNWGYYGVSTLGGYYGLGAESLTDGNNNFSFKRSWFFFDDEIVCVGGGINANHAGLGGIKTLLFTSEQHGGTFQSSNGTNSVPTTSDHERELGALTWLQQNDMGYYFPGGTNVSAEGLGANYTRVYLNHGSTPSNASFAAVLLPNHSAAEVQNYANNGGVEVLQRDANAHVVRDRSSNVVAVAAFTPLSRNEVTTNLPGYILYQNANNEFGLSLYNPHREAALSVNTVDDRVNPMVDFEVRQPTAHAYKVQVPFRVRKGSGKGMDLFEVSELSANRSELQVNLRVYRKFEIAGTTNSDGSITLNSAWIAWNDAAENEPATPPPTNRFPVARINGAANGYVGEALNFNGASSYDPDGGSIVNYAWQFGDNTSASGAYTAHTFTAPGNYTLSLEVTDDEGAKSKSTFEVNIQTQPTGGEQLRVLISSDDKYEIYINGARLGANASWTSAEEYRAPLLDGKNVIAVKAENWDQAGALVAEVYAVNKFWPSDTKWKVSLADQSAWQEIAFDDSRWLAATSHGAHGVAQPWAQFQNVTGISTDKGVHWIWSADKRQDHVVYLRLIVSPGADTQAPAVPTGIRIGTQ